MNNLNIVFMGTPDFAVTILDELIKHKYNIVGVVTAPDKLAGRGRKLNQSAVKQYALKHNLNILQPTNLKSTEFLTELKALKANLQIIVAFRMLPKVVWQMPALGTFNLHASLLPQYRGAAPINWAIINGENQTGVSTFFIDEKIDTGEMIFQEIVTIETNENAGSLHNKLMHTGSKLVIKTVKAIEASKIKTIPQQDFDGIKTAYKLNRDNCKIDFNEDIHTIHNLIRGLDPYPAAYCELINGENIIETKIHKTEKIIETHRYNTGHILANKKELKVAVKGGFINIIELKLSGKRKMKAIDLINGFKFELNAKLR